MARPPFPPPRKDAKVSEMRRLIVLAIVKSGRGLTISQIYQELVELHEKGQWPKSDKLRPDPYYGIIPGILKRLQRDGKVVQMYRDGTYVSEWTTPAHYQGLAKKLLPTTAEQEELIPLAEGFVRDTGMELHFGVTDPPTMNRVILVDTKRGSYSTQLNPKETWMECLTEVLEDGDGWGNDS